MASGRNEKLWKLKVVKIKSGQNEVVKIKKKVSSVENENWLKKVVRIKSGPY